MGSNITCCSWLIIMLSSSLAVFFKCNLTTLAAAGRASSATNELIEQTCKNTKYYDLCVSSLKSDASSLKAADAKGLALIMIKVGIHNATATNSYLSSQILTAVATNGTLMTRVMRECADKYASAIEALQNSTKDLSADMYDYAYMDVMAASDYPNACHNAFIKAYPGLLVYPQELGKREEGLKRICDVAMGIINALIGF